MAGNASAFVVLRIFGKGLTPCTATPLEQTSAYKSCEDRLGMRFAFLTKGEPKMQKKSSVKSTRPSKSRLGKKQPKSRTMDELIQLHLDHADVHLHELHDLFGIKGDDTQSGFIFAARVLVLAIKEVIIMGKPKSREK